MPAHPHTSPIEEARVDGAGGVSPVSRVVDVEGIPMSGLLIEADAPRAVIVALHGGAAKSVYWDCPGHPELSLMRQAVAQGFTVLALDRPGYGSSRPHREDMTEPARRVELAYAATDAILGSGSRGAGVFLWGHSVGSELTMRMAVDNRNHDILGLELSGTGREHHALAADIFGGKDRYANARGVGELLWTPEDIYPEDMLGGAKIASSTPAYEGVVTASWPRDNFPALASKVRVPVNFTAAEHEKVWRNDPSALDEVAAMFTQAPRVQLHVEPGGGHNLSIGYAAPAYHRHVLAFLEDCIEERARSKDFNAMTETNGKEVR